MTREEHYMREAIKQARKAEALREVPIGCVIVYEDRIIARGYNRRNTDKKHPLPRRTECNPEGQPEAWRLAAGRLYALCHSGTMPDVRRGHRTGKNSGSCHRMHESESRLCRLDSESS